MSRHTYEPVTRVLGTSVGVLADLLFPPRCGLCGAVGSFLCEPCEEGLPGLTGRRCPTCADLLSPRGVCGRCAALAAQPLDSLQAAFVFEEGARRLVHRLKYERLSALAGPMGGLMAPVLASPAGFDLIVPVPLHPRRQRDRGFNQAELLAREISRFHGVEMNPRALVRVRPTRPQVRTAGHTERASNVAGAFACRSPVARRHVLLVDDVATTGATLRACAEPLRRAGAAAVHALVFAHDG